MENVTANVLDVTYFGYGVGLVLCGFVAGSVVSIVLSALNKVKYL